MKYQLIFFENLLFLIMVSLYMLQKHGRNLLESHAFSSKENVDNYNIYWSDKGLKRMFAEQLS